MEIQQGDERALKQIESVKKLTRVRNGLIWDKDKTDKKH